MSAARALAEFLRFPSVGSDPARATDVRQCAAWLVGHLRQIGFPFARAARTPGAPVVYAEWPAAPPAPTVLVYGHYDVQPPGPRSAWRAPPFEPVVRGGAVYARGAADDKGPVLALLAGAAAHRARRAAPVNLKVLVEGEEESGSPHLPALVRRHRARLAADCVLAADAPGAGPDRPALVYALRGTVRLCVDVFGAPRAVHSGLYGGAVRDPARVLAELLAGLHDRAGRVRVPGFYADVAAVPAGERAALRRVAPRDAEVARAAGAPGAFGEPGYGAYERTVLRPAVVVTGLAAGDARCAGANIVPASARAALNVRLVPNQDPARVVELVRRHFVAAAPPGARVVVRADGGAARAARADPAHPALRAAVAALAGAFGTEPVLLRCGGTVPAVGLFAEELAAPTVMFGVTRPDDGQHGPNERFHLADFARTARAAARFFDLFARHPVRSARA